MIWHFVEVWLLVVLTFVLGCLAGAHLYGLVAASRFAPAQGAVADAVGNVLDRIKARVGLAPAWRPAHLRHIERPLPPPPEPEVLPEPEPYEDVSAEIVEAAPPLSARVGRSAVPDAVPAGRRRLFSRRSAASRSVPPGSQPALPLPEPVPQLPRIAPKRPAGLAAPRGGIPDNLQRIKGIGRRNERLLNELGIYHFGQIAAWTPGEALWIGQHLSFPERVSRDDWVGQATLLAMGSETGFQKSAERRRERRRQQREFQARMTSAAYDSPAAEAYDEPAYPVDGDEQDLPPEPVDNDADDVREEAEDVADNVEEEVSIEDFLPMDEGDDADAAFIEPPDDDEPEAEPDSESDDPR